VTLELVHDAPDYICEALITLSKQVQMRTQNTQPRRQEFERIAGETIRDAASAPRRSTQGAISSSWPSPDVPITSGRPIMHHLVFLSIAAARLPGGRVS
jgi:hypothetical protein